MMRRWSDVDRRIACSPSGLGCVRRPQPRRLRPARRCAFEGANYTVCTFDARRDDIRVYWKGPDDLAYGGFSRLAEALKAQGRQLRFAMNGGMFEMDLSPVGLFDRERQAGAQGRLARRREQFSPAAERRLLCRLRQRGHHGDDAIS